MRDVPKDTGGPSHDDPPAGNTKKYGIAAYRNSRHGIRDFFPVYSMV